MYKKTGFEALYGKKGIPIGGGPPTGKGCVNQTILEKTLGSLRAEIRQPLRFSAKGGKTQHSSEENSRAKN